jgi:hypothetical protein
MMPSRFVLLLIALTVPLLWVSAAQGACPPDSEPVRVSAGCVGMDCTCSKPEHETVEVVDHQMMHTAADCCCKMDPTDSPFSDQLPAFPACGQESQVRVGPPIEVTMAFPPLRVANFGVWNTRFPTRFDGLAGEVLCVLRL